MHAVPITCHNNPGPPFLEAEHQSSTVKLRAQRFPIRTALRYRRRGETAWSEGTTVNISRTGVLFRTEEKMEPETVLEMQIVFPSGITAGATTHVICWGPVIRTEASLVAATMRHYRFASMSAE